MRNFLSHAVWAGTACLVLPLAHAGPVKGQGQGQAGGAAVTTAVTSQCSLNDLSTVAASCLGYFSGNESASALGEQPGAASWQGINLAALTQYKDDTVGQGSTNSLFDVQRSSTDDSKGELRFLQALTVPFVLTLKGGNNWAAYFLPAGAAAGSTLSFDIPGEQGRGLSHASIYTNSPLSPPQSFNLTSSTSQAVPEPGSMALVVGALGALGWSRRRRGARGAGLIAGSAPSG